MGFWKCKHKNANTQEVLSCWHEGHQCSKTSQDNDCFLYNKGWDFISCQAEYGRIVEKGRKLMLVSKAKVKVQPRKKK